jgi:thymidylate kinase
MFTVALIGPDGAGKSTIGQRLEESLPLPAKYIYMGINLESSNVVLPTTRLILEVRRMRGIRPDMAGPPDPTRRKPKPKGSLKRVAVTLKLSLRMANVMAEEWFRQIVVWSYLRQGRVVLLDRHFFVDYYAHDIALNGNHLPLARRVHGYMLDRLYPRPDLSICLDAPAEVLLARKGEGTLESLERRRQEYLALRDVLGYFVTIDATQAQDEVTRQVSDAIWNFYDTHRSQFTN